MTHKIVLNGFGRMGHLITTDCYSMCGQALAKNSDFLSGIEELIKIREPHVSLVDIYKKVQRKYHPEKDVFSHCSK